MTRKYATEYLGPEEVEEMEDEEFDVEIHSAVIPRLRASSDTYIVFVGHSDVDMEHGVAIVCKNGSHFAVSHSDIAYSNAPWDETAELDQLVGR